MADQNRSRGRAAVWRPWGAAGRRPALAWPENLAGFARRLAQRIREWMLAEVAPGRLVPWLAIAFGCGIVVYFTADREPELWAAVALFCGSGRSHFPRRSASRQRRPALPPLRANAPSSSTRCCRRRCGTPKWQASSRCARSASARIASWCGSSASRRHVCAKSSNGCGVGAQGHRARGRGLRRLQGAPVVTSGVNLF
jgi:hypothetical protein